MTILFERDQLDDIGVMLVVSVSSMVLSRITVFLIKFFSELAYALPSPL